MPNPFDAKAKKTLSVNGKEYSYYSLPALGDARLSTFPKSHTPTHIPSPAPSLAEICCLVHGDWVPLFLPIVSCHIGPRIMSAKAVWSTLMFDVEKRKILTLCLLLITNRQAPLLCAHPFGVCYP